MPSNIDEARQVARTLLDDLETVTVRTEGILMKAKRLARLMRDADTQRWLGYETLGYPSKLNLDELGTCKKYAEAGGRINAEGKYYLASLPALEADAEGKEAQVNSFRKIDAGPIIENYVVKRATEEFINKQLQIQQSYREALTKYKALVVSLKSAIHSYATDTLLAIEFGDIAQDIFERARSDVDNFVRAYCPKAAEQIVAINERMRDQTNESRTAALTSCRRLLLTVADALFPPKKKTGLTQRDVTEKSDPMITRIACWLISIKSRAAAGLRTSFPLE